MNFISTINAVVFGLALYGRVLGADDFQNSIFPLLKERCNSCHSTEKQKGDLDLERFASVADIKREPMIWEGVLEQIHMGRCRRRRSRSFPPNRKRC